MVRFLVAHPISVFVFYAALCLVALISIWYLPISLLPNIEVPQIRIITEEPNRSPEEIEKQILAPIRTKLLQIDGLIDLSSVASFEKGEIDLKFDYGVDIDYAFLEVNEGIDRAINILPKEVQRPKVIRKRTEDIPVFFLSVSYKDKITTGDFYQLSQFVDQVARRRFEQLPEVAVADIHGQVGQQIVIAPDKYKLKDLDVTINDLEQALQTNNLSFGSVIFKERNYQYLLRLGQPLETVEDLKNVTLLINNRLFLLNDLAKISTLEKDFGGSYITNDQQAISIAIIKSHQSKIENLRTQINILVDQLEQENPHIEIKISRDNTFILKYTIRNLKNNLILGCFLAIALVFLFYRNWRSSLLVGLSVPISILACLLFFSIFDLTINMITLSGIILGLGLMIDNGIIVLDNIVQEHSSEGNIQEASIKGTNEMIRPLLTSILTTCSVFIPLIFLSGISGALFYEQAMAISIGLLLSFLVSITFLPVTYHYIEKKRYTKTRSFNLLHQFYSRGLNLVFAFPICFFILLFISLFSACYLTTQLPLKIMPDIPSASFEILIDWKEPPNHQIFEQRIKALTNLIGEELLYYDAHIGEDQYLIHRNADSAPSASIVFIEFKDQNSESEIKQKLSDYLRKNYPEAYYEFRPKSSDFELLFPKTKEDIKVEVFSNRLSIIGQKQILKHISDSLKNTFENLDISTPSTEERLLLSPNFENLLFYKVEYSDLFNKLRQLISGSEVMSLNQAQEKSSVVIGSPGLKSISILLNKEQIINQEGHYIPLHYLVKLEKIAGWQQVEASSQGKYLPLKIKTDNPKTVLNYLKKINYKDRDYNLILRAAYYQNMGLVRELAIVLIITLFLLYLIMTIQFESFVQPVIILLEIPISLSGSILALYLFGGSLSIMAMIGMVVTVGIVINDSIIKIDTINHLVKNGLPLKEAIHLGGQKRLNPIIMTTLTTILAVVPIFFSRSLGAVLQYPLVLTLSGGLIIGTLMSLYLLPFAYFQFYRNKT